jgi:hypothetical protein
MHPVIGRIHGKISAVPVVLEGRIYLAYSVWLVVSSYFQIPHANPASNFLETYYPQQIGGVEMNNYDNAPGGSYCTLGIGTRVLVIFTDNSVYGFIIAQVPYEDEMSQVIKNLKED